MPVHTYKNWNSRPSDSETQIEPFRKYFFICEGANTETFYFKRLIDLRKQLNIHPLIDIRLWEKTEGDKNLSFPKKLADFAQEQKKRPENGFDERNRYYHAYEVLQGITGMNAKKNPDIGSLAEDVLVAIEQEKLINQDIHQLKGKVSSNIGKIIGSIINESPKL